MAKPVHIFIDRKELTGYTSMSLTRSKEAMTGELNVEVFMGWLPEEPIMIDAVRGREVLVYVGGHLAFTGYIDRRSDQSGNSSKGDFSSTRDINVGPDSYSLTITARGKTKYIIDSSHQHATGTFLKPTNKEVFDGLVGPFGIEIDWQADEIDLDRVRLRDGSRVADELQRISEQTSLYAYETVDGKIKVTDGREASMGEAIVLGVNILDFSTEQAEDSERNQVQVKGQKTAKGTWGTDAVIPTLTGLRDNTITNFSPVTVQLFGNATDDLLEKRAQYEINKRMSQSKRVTVDMFHIQQSAPAPWDLGVLHYVEIPPSGIFQIMEVIEITYNVAADAKLTTTLTLAPAPVKRNTATGATELLADVPEIDDVASTAASRRLSQEVTFGTGAGQSWFSPELETYEIETTTIATADSEILQEVSLASTRPLLTLPDGYEGETS